MQWPKPVVINPLQKAGVGVVHVLYKVLYGKGFPPFWQKGVPFTYFITDPNHEKITKISNSSCHFYVVPNELVKWSDSHKVHLFIKMF